MQRVKRAAVIIDGAVLSSIEDGMLIYAGFAENDECLDLNNAKEKILNFRIFEDENKKMNKNIKEAGGSVLLVSQFTLAANLSNGNRPSFDSAMPAQAAERLFQNLYEKLRAEIHTEKGVFGAFMEIDSVNSGPATFIMELTC